MAFQGDSIYWVEVEKIVPNPFQPRREFDQHKLQELADSIRMYGVLQPLTVTRREIQREDGTFYSEYELIAGERRLRASKLAQVSQVPVIIRDGEQSEQEKLELAIIENLQREDLNAVDRALAFEQLANLFGLSHVQVAQKMGRSREYVSNSIRLLGLPSHMLDALRLAKLSEGHARTLLMLNDRKEEQEVVFQEILLKKLSVREVERIARKIATDKVRKRDPDEFDATLLDIEKRFTETLGTRVQIQKTDFGGKLTIDYFSTDDLETILNRMKAEQKMQMSPASIMMAETLSEATPLDVRPVVSTVASPVEEVSPVIQVAPTAPTSFQYTPVPTPTPLPTIPPQVTTVAPAPVVPVPISTTPFVAAVPSYGAPLHTPVPIAPPAIETSYSPEFLTAMHETLVIPEVSDEEAEQVSIDVSDEGDSDLYSMHNFTV